MSESEEDAPAHLDDPSADPSSPDEAAGAARIRGRRWWLRRLVAAAVLAGAGVFAVNGFGAYQEAQDTRDATAEAREELEALESRIEELASTRAEVEATIARLADARSAATEAAAAEADAQALHEAAIAALEADAAMVDATIAALYEDVKATAEADSRVADVFAGAVDRANRRDVDGMNAVLAGQGAEAVAALESSTAAMLEAVRDAKAIVDELGSSLGAGDE